MLAFDTLAALFVFGFVAAVTPGPNNIMLATSGVNFGFARTLPHMAGIIFGFTLMTLAMGSGIGAVVLAWPAAKIALTLAGASYLLWLAWRVAVSGGFGGDASAARPMTFLQAAVFQWVNPKGIIVALSAMAVFVRPEHAPVDVATITAIFAVVSTACVTIWAAFGAALRDVLSVPARVRAFNVAMAALLVASVVPIAIEGLAPLN